MHMHRTTILLPEELRSGAEAYARRKGISLGELIRRQLGKLIKPKKANKRDDDPIFRYHTRKHVEPVGNPVEDGVANHDKYIAEAFEAEMRRWR